MSDAYLFSPSVYQGRGPRKTKHTVAMSLSIFLSAVELWGGGTWGLGSLSGCGMKFLCCRPMMEVLYISYCGFFLSFSLSFLLYTKTSARLSGSVSLQIEFYGVKGGIGSGKLRVCGRDRGRLARTNISSSWASDGRHCTSVPHDCIAANPFSPPLQAAYCVQCTVSTLRMVCF